MSLFHTSLKAGASLALLALVSVPASAAAFLDGGGSSLLAPYLAQVYCARIGGFGSTGLCNAPATSTDKVRLYNSSAQQDVVSTTSVASSPDSADTFRYLISNSGGGQKAILAQTPSLLGTYPSGVSAFGVVNFGFSDAALSSAALNAYANGGDIGDLSISLKAPDGSTVGTPAYTLYANPQASTFGPLIQIPMTIDPVAIGYNPTGLTGLTGTLKLSKATYCGIFNGTITDWNDNAITTDNGGSVTGGVSKTIHLVGRTNGSGTTSIFTHHLAAVCTGSSNQFTDANLSAGAYKNIPSSLQSSYSLQSDSAHEVSAINSTDGAIGYVGADYATPSTAVSTTVQSALLKSDNGNYYDPSAANALTAFGSITPPSGSARLDPANWVPATAANPSAGYNIIGTTNAILYRWYGSNTSARVNALVAPASSGTEGFLRWYYRNGDNAPSTIMGAANLGVLPSNWNTAITESFIDGSDGLNLCIRTTQSAACGQ